MTAECVAAGQSRRSVRNVGIGARLCKIDHYTPLQNRSLGKKFTADAFLSTSRRV